VYSVVGESWRVVFGELNVCWALGPVDFVSSLRDFVKFKIDFKLFGSQTDRARHPPLFFRGHLVGPL